MAKKINFKSPCRFDHQQKLLIDKSMQRNFRQWRNERYEYLGKLKDLKMDKITRASYIRLVRDREIQMEGVDILLFKLWGDRKLYKKGDILKEKF